MALGRPSLAAARRPLTVLVRTREPRSTCERVRWDLEGTVESRTPNPERRMRLRTVIVQVRYPATTDRSTQPPNQRNHESCSRRHLQKVTKRRVLDEVPQVPRAEEVVVVRQFAGIFVPAARVGSCRMTQSVEGHPVSDQNGAIERGASERELLGQR